MPQNDTLVVQRLLGDAAAGKSLPAPDNPYEGPQVLGGRSSSQIHVQGRGQRRSRQVAPVAQRGGSAAGQRLGRAESIYSGIFQAFTRPKK